MYRGIVGRDVSVGTSVGKFVVERVPTTAMYMAMCATCSAVFWYNGSELIGIADAACNEPPH